MAMATYRTLVELTENGQFRFLDTSAMRSVYLRPDMEIRPDLNIYTWYVSRMNAT